MKNVLFVGNSFTFYHDLPAMVQLLSVRLGMPLETGSVTMGRAFLHQFADPKCPLHVQLKLTYGERKWDLLVLQDQSSNAMNDPEDHCRAIRALHERFPTGEGYAVYQTWAYRDGSEKLRDTGCTYEEMWAALREGSHQAGGLLLPAGDAFRLVHDRWPEIDLYEPDDFHPSAAGTYLTACVILHKLLGVPPLEVPDLRSIPADAASRLRQAAADAVKE